jgi:hypothetical protein
MGEQTIKDVYFRRFLVPLIVTLLILCGIAVILATPPGTPVKWDTFQTVLSKQVAGARRSFLF